MKSTLLDGRLRLNAAVFHEEYSDQQSSQAIATPPFRVTTNIPELNFDGLEVETSAVLGAGFDASIGVGYIEPDGEMPANISRYSVNLAINQRTQIAPDWEWTSRADYRQTGSYSSVLGDTSYTIAASDEVNLSTSLTHDRWSAGLFVKNVFDHRQASAIGAVGPTLMRMVNMPRSYYLELSYRY